MMIHGRYVALLLLLVSVGLQTQAGATVDLGMAKDFAVLGGSTVTNTGSSVINGDLGVSPGTAITGFPPGTVNGTIHANDAVAIQAKADLTAAYVLLSNMGFTQDLTGQDLGGMTLKSGVYRFSSSAQLTGKLTLDAENDPDALFVFQIGSTLTTADQSLVEVINAPYADFCQKYFVVGSSATLGTWSDFEGTILAQESITLTTGADIRLGRALAQTGAVTLDSNTVSTYCGQAPEPASLVLLGCAAGAGAWMRRRKANKTK